MVAGSSAGGGGISTHHQTQQTSSVDMHVIREVLSEEEGRSSLNNRKKDLLNVHDVQEEMAVKTSRKGRKSLDYASDSIR